MPDAPRKDAMRVGRCEMHLTDGRVVMLTGLTADEVFALLAREQVTPALIRETRHYVTRRVSTT